MNNKDTKELIDGLIVTSPYYLSALQEFYDNNKNSKVGIDFISAWFFSQGYLACIEFMKTKEMTRPYKYEPKEDIK